MFCEIQYTTDNGTSGLMPFFWCQYNLAEVNKTDSLLVCWPTNGIWLSTLSHSPEEPEKNDTGLLNYFNLV